MGWSAVPAAIGGISSLGSGIKGKQAANEANRRQAQVDQTNQQLLTQGMGMMENMQNQANSFLTGGGVAGDLMNQAMTGGQALQTQLGGITSQLQGATPTFDFQTGNNLMDQTMQTFRDFAANQRNAALDQAGQAFTSQAGALDAALAGRGLSRNSGVAAGALGQLATGQSQAMAGLNRDLANQAGQIGLQGAQFDVNRMLQEQQLGSNFALGSAAQQAQNLGLAGNLATQAYTTPLGMQQQLYQQNQIMPYMQMMSMTNPMDLLSMAFGGMTGATQQAGQNAAMGGAGMGSGLASLTGQMFDFLSNKNKPGGSQGNDGGTWP